MRAIFYVFIQVNAAGQNKAESDISHEKLKFNMSKSIKKGIKKYILLVFNSLKWSVISPAE